MEQVRGFAELSSAIVKEIEVRRDGEWGKRLLKDRVLIGKVMDGFMDRAPGMPPRCRCKRAPVPISQALGAEKKRWRCAMPLVTGCRNFAAAASFAAKQKANDELCAILQRHNEDLVKALNPIRATIAAIAQFEFCAELTALLFSEEEAELLRRRGRAAHCAAA